MDIICANIRFVKFGQYLNVNLCVQAAFTVIFRRAAFALSLQFSANGSRFPGGVCRRTSPSGWTIRLPNALSLLPALPGGAEFPLGLLPFPDR